MSSRIHQRLSSLESRFHVSPPTPEELKEQIKRASIEVLEHVYPRLFLKFGPGSPKACPHCGDTGLGGTGCAAESAILPGETRLRDLEHAIDRATPQILADAISLAHRELLDEEEIDVSG